MYNLKKVIASICVIAMMLTTVAFGATYSDVAEDSAYYEAVETLNKLEIVTGYEDGTYKPEDSVTRAEMAALIARIQGFGDTANGSAVTGFADVPANYWASGYIANAAGMGIINGYGDGNFGPEDPVLYEQAVKMIMATLGYTPYANENGGYPAGYLAAAQRYDVSLAVANAAVGTEANRGTVAQLLANALDTPLMVQSKWNTNGEVEHVIADGKTYDYKTLMSENLGYVKLKGIVVENATTALGGAKANLDTTAVATVKIDVEDSYDTNNKAYLNYVPGGAAAGKEFLVGETDAADYLGYAVIAYVKEVNEKFELISIAKDTNTNDTLTIALDQFNGITGTEVSYYKAGANSATKVDVVSGFDGIYNGIGMDGATALGIVGTNCLFGGEMTFIDNAGDKKFDAVIIDLASTGVVKKVTEDGINFYNNVTWKVAGSTATTKAIEIDVDDETKFVEITKDGEVINFTDLEAWDVISIYAVSETADVIKAEVVGSEVVGVISSSKDSKTSAFPVSSPKAYKIADTWYDVAAGAYGLGTATVGDGGTFFIDKFGKIAAFDEDAALATGVAGTYGYVIAVKADDAEFGGTAKAEGKIQMLTADGVQVLPLKAKFKVKANSAAAGSDVDTTAWADTVDGSGNVTATAKENGQAALDGLAITQTVVKYVKNSAGEISEITKAAAADEKFATGTVSATYGSPVTLEWDAENNRLKGGTTAYVDADSTLFIVDTDYRKCKMGTIADLDDENTYAIIATYADRKATDNNMVVVKAASFDTSATASIAVITEVGTGANEDGDGILSLAYLMNGEEYFADTVGVTDLKVTSAGDALGYANISVGDIVKVKVGSDDLISAITFIANFTEDTVRDYTNAAALVAVDTTGSAGTGGNEAFDGGYVTAYNENNTLATLNSGNQYKLSQAVNTYVIDGTGKNLVIKNGSDGNFKYFEKLYGTTDITIYDVNNVFGWASSVEGADTVYKTAYDFTQTTPGTYDTPTDVAAAQKIADHIYVRTYENKVTDVVIVKGADIKVK